MFGQYYRAKRLFAFGLAAFVAIGVGTIELTRNTKYVETTGTIVSLDQTCAQGGSGPMHYGDCSDAPTQADRRTVILLRYVSPADKQEHQASVRCDTSVEQTPGWLIGQQLDILAHRKVPGTIDRRRCTPVENAAGA